MSPGMPYFSRDFFPVYREEDDIDGDICVMKSVEGGNCSGVKPDGREFMSRAIECRITPIHLQRFAAEDEGRTEDPTERRKREERDKGNVPKSQDIPQSLILLGTVITLFVLGTWIYSQAYSVFHRFLGGDFQALHMNGVEDAKRVIFDLFWESGKIVAPVMITAFIMGVIANVAQVGLLFTLRPLEFKPERMKPDFKRVLPVRRTMVNLLKITVQFTVILIVTYLVIADDFIPMLRTQGMELRQAISLFAWASFKMLIAAGIILLGMAIPDYFYQRFEYMENLKMTMSEVKRERKEEEGDPLIRQRQREKAMELRRQRNMLQDVPQADVVITNPTHYAVALKYDPEQSKAPAVTAKGSDHLAFRIRTIARENQIPIEENPPLARTLYRDVEIGQEIPDTLYRVVSLIFAKLDRFRRMKAEA